MGQTAMTDNEPSAIARTSGGLLNGGREDHVNPKVVRVGGAGRKLVAVCVAAVRAILPVRRGVQHLARDTRRGEVSGIVGVVSLGRPVRDNIGGVRADRDGGREVCLLPAGGRFIRERDGGEQSAGASPEVSIVGSEVLGALVKPYSGDIAGDIQIG